MKYPDLTEWESTAWGLHQASMLLGPIQNAVFAPRKNYLHLPMFIDRNGLVSQRLPQGGTIYVNFKEAVVEYKPSEGEPITFALDGHTQATLFESLLGALKADELAAFFEDVQADSLAADLMTKLHADESRVEFLKLEDVTHTEQLATNSETASAYADVLHSVYCAVSRFRARLGGHITPIVVWPEHFDLSTLWFDTENTEMDDHKAHVSIGFAPYTPGLSDQPYLYAYAYPYPEPLTPPEVPQPAFWQTEGFQGVVINYMDLQQQEDPEEFIRLILVDIFTALQSLLKGS